MKCKKCSRRPKFLHLLKKLRYYIFATLVLLVAGIVFFFFLRRVLLESYQHTETNLAQSYALEVEGGLNTYETLISYGTHMIDARDQEGDTEEELRNRIQQYCLRIQTVLDDQVDPYVVYDGKIIAANPWEGDADYDYTSAVWYQKALEADGKVIFTDVYTDVIYDRAVVTVAQKCADSDAVVAMDIFPENLAIQPEGTSPSEGTSIFICDSSGRTVYSRTDLDVTEEQVQSYIDRILAAVEKGRLARYDSFVTGVDGVRRGIYYADTSNGWKVIITVPVDRMLTQLTQFMAFYFAIMCAWIAGFVVTVGHNLRLDSLVERSDETVQVLSNSYEGLFRINFREDTYEIIKGSTYAWGQLSREGSYADFIHAVTRLMDRDTANEFCKSFSTDSLQNLQAQHIRDYGGDFLGRYPSGDRWINIRVLFDAALGEDEAVLCFREVDQKKRREIQERKLLEETLAISRRNEKSKLAFFNNMSHDMRTPLNAILGVLDLLRQHAGEPDRVLDYADKIAYSGRQLLDLVNDILEMSRLEQGKVTLNHQAFDLENCIRACADSFTPQARRENKPFEIHCDIRDTRVMGDVTRMTQMLNNLLSNAFKFTSEGDTVSLSVRQMGNPPTPQYQIVVRDTGIGMSEEFLPHLFEPYVRETRFFSRQVVGTGLGMPIVKSLVTQMSGQIYVDSKLGEGTTFTITLPFITAQAEEERREQKEKPAAPARAAKTFSLKGKKILLAEDNVLNMEIASEILSMNGVEVLQAWNGREAVDLFLGSAPFAIDAILMDMQMPVMDGCEAARKIRAADRPDAPVIPIVAVTANAFAEDIAATTAAGMNAHISKPIDFRTLCYTLEHLLDKGPAQEAKNL